MSDFLGFKDSYIKSDPQSSGPNSGSISGAESSSPPPTNSMLSKQQSLNIPNMNMKGDSDLILSRSLDIKKQLSSSFQGASSHGNSGGIHKPQTRKNSSITIKSNDASEDEYEYDDDNDNKHNSKGNTQRRNNNNDDGGGNGGDDDEDDSGHERKRRDNINEKIQELLTLVPPEFFQENAPTNGQASSQSGNNESEHDAAIAAAVKNSGTKDGKPNKGQILTKSVEYIQYLQKVIDDNNRKEVELIMKLKTLELRRENRQSNVPINVGHTSAEVALGEIGVGPLSDDYFKQVLQNSSRRGGNSSP